MTVPKGKAMSEPDNKFEALKSSLAPLGQVAVAFSGGVDSTFLLWTAKQALGEGAVALTARLRSVPEFELRDAGSFCHAQGIRQIVVDIDELSLPAFRDNPPDRCYHCKQNILTHLKKAAGELGVSALAEGSNADDLGDYRPGRRAVLEAGVISPLLEAGMTKTEIRELSRRFGLPTWDKPAYACLASRIPFGEEITEEKLRRVERAEGLLMDLGFREIRVRAHGDMARVESRPEDIQALCRPDVRERLTEALRGLGFRYVSLDLEGYRRGSLNPREDKK